VIFLIKHSWFTRESGETGLREVTMLAYTVCLIHKITHATIRERISVDHGAKCRNRLRKEANKARDMGEIDLANELEADLHQYGKRL
jgi:hypothetical protein